MVTTSINQVLSIAQNKQIQFFKIFDATGKQLYYSQDDENITPSEAYNELNDQLKNFDNGIVSVQLSEKSFKEIGKGGSVKGFSSYFKVRTGQSLTPAINGLMNEDVKNLMNEVAELRLKLMLQEQEHKNLEAQRKLEEKIEGLKDNDPFEKYAPTLMPIIAQMFGTGTPQIQPNINGTETTSTDDKKTIITKAVNRLLKIDPDFAQNITLLADFGEKNPEKYKSFIPMLKIM
jgi:hypothetical protein